MRLFSRKKATSSLSEMYRSARSLEAIEDFSRANVPSEDRVPEHSTTDDREYHGFSEDQQFWDFIFDTNDAWGRTVVLDYFVLSEWVPRVPGLFWSRGAAALRELATKAVQYESDGWTIFSPFGKSQKVLGGIGTLKFPPDEKGYRLVSVSAGQNASSGVPVLISPDAWEWHGFVEGHFIPRLTAKWLSMANSSWADRFISIRGIPKGFLVINRPDQAERSNVTQIAPTQFHPCTVMEYYTRSAKLYDFVYASADSGDSTYRSQLEHFFDKYKRDKGRYGRYLLAGDLDNPMWEADFESPEALQRAEPGAKSQLELLQARVRGDVFRDKNLEAIVELLAEKYDNDGLKRIAAAIGVPESHWYTGRASADSAVDLLNVCVDRNKVEELLDGIAIDYPESFM